MKCLSVRHFDRLIRWVYNKLNRYNPASRGKPERKSSHEPRGRIQFLRRAVRATDGGAANGGSRAAELSRQRSLRDGDESPQPGIYGYICRDESEAQKGALRAGHARDPVFAGRCVAPVFDDPAQSDRRGRHGRLRRDRQLCQYRREGSGKILPREHRGIERGYRL